MTSNDTFEHTQVKPIDLERHIRTHTGKTNDLERHIRTHTGKTNDLKRHIRTHTGKTMTLNDTFEHTQVKPSSM